MKTPISIQVSRASSSAIEAIENAGGSIETVHYNALALRALLKPEKFKTIPKQARPNPTLIKYYCDYKNRGYLSPEMQLRRVSSVPEEQDVVPM